METFNLKCPDCGANVEYDAATNLLYCVSCGQFFEADKVKTNVKVEEIKTEQAWHSQEETQDTTEKMEVNIFHCSSCGAEIMTNDVEVSKYCAYCGQSTIIFDRVSQEKRPDKILPFKITKEDAITRVKEHFAKAKYLPDEVDGITVNSVYGIYMPYWVFDTYTELGINITKQYKNEVRKYNEFGTKDMYVTLDASKRLNDNISLALNPFPVEDALDFEAGYLSGFYADRYDVSFEIRKDEAREIAKQALKQELYYRNPDAMQDKIMIDTYGKFYNIIASTDQTESTYGEKYELNSIEYVFMPIYFITFNIQNRLTNILVNGATGKIVGGVPVDKRKIKKSQITGMIIWGLILGIAGAFLCRYLPLIWSVGFFVILTAFIMSAGLTARNKFEKMQHEINSASMFSISNHRE